jgi:hypothetical protein
MRLWRDLAGEMFSWLDRASSFLIRDSGLLLDDSGCDMSVLGVLVIAS